MVVGTSCLTVVDRWLLYTDQSGHVCLSLQKGRAPLLAAVQQNHIGVVSVLVSECKCNKAATNQVLYMVHVYICNICFYICW